MKKGIMWLCSAFVLVALTGCFGAKSTSMAGRGGEVVGGLVLGVGVGFGVVSCEW